MVYPRLCGGTWLRGCQIRSSRGLSPPVRGNRWTSSAAAPAIWSIPACAGEPRQAGRPRPPSAVYPRLCGGTTDRPHRRRTGHGLSPPVRGNLPGGAWAGVCAGSIPACAGEPTPMAVLSAMMRVYPRLCGGTKLFIADASDNSGLSPPVRGNPLRGCNATYGRGSIPACAGEPAPATARPYGKEVYPRLCGGTHKIARPKPLNEGLSPPVRGNHIRGCAVNPAAGSIPACAGEPHGRGRRETSATVYPRLCGGTLWRAGAAA